MTDEQAALEKEWADFCSAQQKAAMAKGTVGKTGHWEERRAELWDKLVKAGLRTKDGYSDFPAVEHTAC